jgi:hypothetical protein
MSRILTFLPQDSYFEGTIDEFSPIIKIFFDNFFKYAKNGTKFLFHLL